VKPARTVVLDNEAIQAIADVTHGKHRRLLASIEVVASRNLRKAGSVRLVVPTAVRVEAGRDRRSSGPTVTLNRLRTDDAPLDTPAADRAAALRNALDLSVADSHVGAVIQEAQGPVAVVTSDGGDVRRIADHLGIAVNVVAI
jgi:predicted nucleic acid-binding protein